MYRKQRSDGRGRGDARLLLPLGQRPYLAVAELVIDFRISFIAPADVP